LTLDELKPLLKAFKFNYLFEDDFGKEDDTLSLKKFKNEFKFNLS